MMPEDRVALVTGASRGIGRTAALRLAEVCARVCVNSLDDEKGADDVVSRLRERGVDSFQKQAVSTCILDSVSILNNTTSGIHSSSLSEVSTQRSR